MSDQILMYVAVAMVGIIGGIFLYVTAKYPSKVREWLLWAVTTAEKEYGSGTGQIKLRAVYDLFLAKFPKLSIFVSFDTFSGWVDIALDQMRKMLENNPAVSKMVTK